MTIQELIEELEKLDDKTRKVHVCDEDGYMSECGAFNEYGDIVELY